MYRDLVSTYGQFLISGLIFKKVLMSIYAYYSKGMKLKK